MSKYIINEVNEDLIWDEYIRASEEGSIFSESLFLNNTCKSNKKFVVLEKEEVKSGFNIFLSDDGKNIISDPLSIHNSLFFLNQGSKKKIQIRKEQYKITEYIVDFLTKNYKNIYISLVPQFNDLRPFQWFNYHNEHGDKKFNFFDFSLRYTSYLNIKELNCLSDKDIFNNNNFRSMDKLRQRHLKKAVKENAFINYSGSPSTLIEFYDALMKKQQINIEKIVLKKMTKIMNSFINKNRGKIFEVYNSKSELLYSVFYVWDFKRAYYLYGAGNPNFSSPWQGTFAHWKSFEYLANIQKIEIVDLEGVNSPNRGWFKLGFGGNLLKYFIVQRKVY